MPTTTMTAIRRAKSSENDLVADILADAFANDPACNWVWNDPALAPKVSRAFFGVFAGMALEAGEVYIDADQQGVALWLPFDPSEQHDSEELQAALTEAIGPFRERGDIIDALMAEAHPVHAVHAYLPFIGVAQRGQGKGVGGALLQSRTHYLDQQGLPAYLEATTLEAARLYERHGFRHMEKTIDLPGGPSMYPMWREAR